MSKRLQEEEDDERRLQELVKLEEETSLSLREPTPETLAKMERIRKALAIHEVIDQIYVVLGNLFPISLRAILIDVYIAAEDAVFMQVVIAVCKGENVPDNDYSPEIFDVLDTFTEKQRSDIVDAGNLDLSLFTILR